MAGYATVKSYGQRIIHENHQKELRWLPSLHIRFRCKRNESISGFSRGPDVLMALIWHFANST